MRYLIVAVGLGLLSQVAPTVGLPRIERHRIGVVEIGASEQRLIEAFPSERRELVDLQLEGMPAPAYLLRFVGAKRRDGVVAELIPSGAGLIVWRIQVRDPVFRTTKGIGIGSTVGALRAAYHLDSIASGEGNVAIVVNELSASFSVDQTGPGGGDLWKARTPAVVPESVKITGIVLFR
jgi:hypothetical protein